MRIIRTIAATGLALGTMASTPAPARADTAAAHLSFEPPEQSQPAHDLAEQVEQPKKQHLPDEHGGPAPPWRADPDWTIQFEPMAWFVGPSGKIKLPVNSGTGPGGFTTEGDKIRVNDLELDDTRLRPAGTLTIAHEKWRFAFTGAQYELSHGDVTPDFAGRLGAVAFAPGDRLHVGLSFGMYDATVGYRVWDYDFKQKTGRPEDAADAVITLHLLGGVRFHDLDIDIANGPARAEGSHLWVEPIIGARVEMILVHDFSVIVQLDGGGMPLGSTSSYSIDIRLAFQWRPIDNVGVQIGWRQLAFDLRDGKNLDKFEYDGRMAGLFGGVVIRF